MRTFKYWWSLIVTTMEIERLITLGFRQNEAKVYLALVKYQRSDANTIIKETKLHKKLVYENIEKLIDKGLVGFVIEKNKKIFSITSTNFLIELFEDKIKEELKKKDEAKKIVSELDKVVKVTKTKQEAIVYRGKQGIRTFYLELLKQKKDYVVFGAPEKSIKIMDEIFWRNFNTKRIYKKISARLLFNESIRKYGDSLKDKFTELRYFEKEFEPSTETNIQGDRVGIIVWCEEPFLFLIVDKEVAKSYREYFERMWKISKK